MELVFKRQEEIGSGSDQRLLLCLPLGESSAVCLQKGQIKRHLIPALSYSGEKEIRCHTQAGQSRHNDPFLKCNQRPYPLLLNISEK